MGDPLLGEALGHTAVSKSLPRGAWDSREGHTIAK